jgi:hypothetical protein
MFGGSGGSKGDPQLVAPQAADDRFSLVELRRIYKQLVENKVVNEENQDLVIEILRVIAEMVVYGDNKSELLFDFFCEKSMLSLFLEIMHSEPVCPFAVHVQILQTLSILISCVKNDTSLYYLLSNNHINDILVFNHDFNSDESLSAQFASFMKTLSLRLNDQTVQFFFREDSGAFPILTKAVELLANKDPMIRISAQSTILNIFRVNEQRALAYALQEDNLYVLLECIVGIMRDQLDTLQTLSRSYLLTHQQQPSSASTTMSTNAAATDASVVLTTKIEQNMDDCIIAIEDWIYYLQDLYDLNIPQLQKALSTHLLNAFIYPAILESTLILQPSYSETGDTEISDLTASQAARVDIAMFYLLQLGRIFPSQALRRAIIIALTHPVSQESRCIMSMHLHQQYRQNEQNSASFSWHLPSDVKLKANLFKLGLRGCLLQQLHQRHIQSYQKFATLTMYSIHGILQALFQDFKNAEVGTGALKFESFLIATGFLPNHPFVDLLRSSSTHRSTIVGGEEDLLVEQCLSGDFLTLSELILLRKPLYLQHNSPILDLEPLVQNILFIVQNPQQYSIANLQAACQLLAYVCHVVICAGDVAGEAARNDYSESVSEPLNASCATSVQSPEITPNPNHVSAPSSTTRTIASSKFRYVLSDRLDVLAQALQLAMRSAASALLARAESSFAEMLLILIREEIDRFQGRSWKELHAKLFSEKGLIFPHSPQSHFDVMGLDFLIPISHVETMRKEVQIFLMLRSVLHYLSTSLASFGDGKLLSFEFGTFLLDCAFLSLEDESIVPPHLRSGSPFDMKGKKFLDSTVLVPNAPANVTPAADSNNASPGVPAAVTAATLRHLWVRQAFRPTLHHRPFSRSVCLANHPPITVSRPLRATARATVAPVLLERIARYYLVYRWGKSCCLFKTCMCCSSLQLPKLMENLFSKCTLWLHFCMPMRSWICTIGRG